MEASRKLIAPHAELRLAVEVGKLQRAVFKHFGGRRPKNMVDVGCGYGRPSGFLADHVVGVDPDVRALAANPCIDERIVRPVERLELEREHFDIALLWNVLEHVKDPTDALARVAHGLKPGGILVLALPNLASVRGRITRRTPTWFHRLVIRAALNGGDAEPYPTHMTDALDLTTIVSSVERLGFSTLYCSRYEGYHELRLRELHPVVGASWQRFTRLVSRLTRGRLDYRSDVLCAFVLGGPSSPR